MLCQMGVLFLGHPLVCIICCIEYYSIVHFYLHATNLPIRDTDRIKIEFCSVFCVSYTRLPAVFLVKDHCSYDHLKI